MAARGREICQCNLFYKNQLEIDDMIIETNIDRFDTEHLWHPYTSALYFCHETASCIQGAGGARMQDHTGGRYGTY